MKDPTKRPWRGRTSTGQSSTESPSKPGPSPCLRAYPPSHVPATHTPGAMMVTVPVDALADTHRIDCCGNNRSQHSHAHSYRLRIDAESNALRPAVLIRFASFHDCAAYFSANNLEARRLGVSMSIIPSVRSWNMWDVMTYSEALTAGYVCVCEPSRCSFGAPPHMNLALPYCAGFRLLDC